VPEELKEYAYEDRELEIGFGEVINQPTVVAHMLNLLKPRLGGRYLDIGTGSGWTAALLALTGGEGTEVYSLERAQFLAEAARANLAKYPVLAKNIHIYFRDGRQGLKEFAPYDGIHVAVAFKKLPRELMLQLAVGGRMVIPMVNKDLILVERTSPEKFDQKIEKGYFFKEAEKDVT
jgi:protein-L-isoaspartate(D-aspartate) O-methyltransferase